jgi:hypothetical protein
MKPTHAIIHFLNGEIPESKLLELVPETRDVLAGFKEVYQALIKDRGSKVTVCAICGTAILRRRILAGRPNYCDSERCEKFKKLGHEKPVTLDSVREPTRSCMREIQSYNGGYSE